MSLLNYVGDRWVAGTGEGLPLVDPVQGIELVRASTESVDFAAALRHSRIRGGPALRALTFAQRAALLGRIADVLSANRPEYFKIALANSGSPESDAAIDIDGAIYTLKYYAREGAGLGEARSLREGGLIRVAKDEAFQALHLAVPMRGAAILINAFNFPSWGLWEKAAPALLSGMPVFAKPATSTAWLAQRMVEDVIKDGILPEGSLSIVCGGPGDLLNHVTGEDVVSFTGSADTAARIRTHPPVVRHSTRLNVEADSLNSALLGPDVQAGAPEFDFFVREVANEMTIKAGQKCTAIRRILIPAALKGAVAEALAARLSRTVVGNPRNKDVRMGPLISKTQQRAVIEGISALQREAKTVFDGGADFRPLDADPALAAFVPPTLLVCEDPLQARVLHEQEVFGPVATLMPYKDLDQALEIARLGQGSLVASVFSADPAVIETAALELASGHGRVLAVDSSIGRSQTGHGNVMPMCLHGGPGRAGGGQELGGLRALRFYHQLSVIQGPVGRLQAIARGAAELCF